LGDQAHEPIISAQLAEEPSAIERGGSRYRPDQGHSRCHEAMQPPRGRLQPHQEPL